MNILFIIFSNFFGFLIPNVIFLKSDLRRLENKVSDLEDENLKLKDNMACLEFELNHLKGVDK